jgi:hypothetical protein
VRAIEAAIGVSIDTGAASEPRAGRHGIRIRNAAHGLP